MTVAHIVWERSGSFLLSSTKMCINVKPLFGQLPRAARQSEAGDRADPSSGKFKSEARRKICEKAKTQEGDIKL